jgi:glycosyltransferase involved in cell wall biosynthesis
VTNSAPSVLLLIPAYNEEARIEPTLREYAAYFRAHFPGRLEILVVLNGCRDNTLAVVQRVAKDFPEVQVENFPAPIGKGGALIEGLRHAPKVDLIGYVDADGATPPAAFHALIQHAAWADCVIGSRWLPGAVLHQAQPWFRRFTSRCFHAIVQGLFWMDITDTQCPAKIARRAAIEAIYPQLRIADLAFDVNLLYSLTHAGFKVQELPTEWTDKLGSKVTSSLFRSSAIMFLSTVRLRLVYSPLYERLQPLRWIGDRLYAALRAPVRKAD